MTKLTKEQYDVLRHTLGLDRHAIPYRNYYADEENALIPNELVNQGFMKVTKRIPGGLVYFQVTEAGVARARQPFCLRCEDAGYTYEGGFSMNDEMNVKVPCESCRERWRGQ